MSSTRRSPLARVACAAVFGAAGALALTGGVAEAGKPAPPPPLDGGLVHFTHQGLAWTMNPDGSGKTALPAGVMGAWMGEPSRALHAGRRWYLEDRNIAGEVYPGSNIVRRELFAVRDDGAVVTQLTFQSDLMPFKAMRWGPGDTMVSWVALRWSGGVMGPQQVFTSAVVFDADGNVAGLATQPAGPVSAATGVWIHDWSPDGTRLVLGTGTYGASPSSLWIADLATGGSTALPTSVSATDPAWSPDGTRIAFANYSGGEIRTIAPDGSGETRLFGPAKHAAAGHTLVPAWSPHGTHIVFDCQPNSFSGRGDVFRVSVSGGAATNLTGDLDTQISTGRAAGTLGWR